MRHTRRGKPQRATAALAMLFLGLGTMLVGLLGTAGTASAAADKIEFCHYAGSNDNGGSGNYVLIETSKAAFYNAGHVDHTTDIFPAGTYKGQSWPAQGDQSLIAAGCDSTDPGTETQTQTRTSDGAADCTAQTVQVLNQERSRTKTGDGWGEWSAWETVSTGSRSMTPDEIADCPEVLPGDSKFRTLTDVDCETDTVTLTKQKSERPAEATEYGPWETMETTTRPATGKECPGEIETLPTEATSPGGQNNPGNPNNPGGGEPEVLGIEANAPAAAPAAAPTAVDAGLTAQESGSSTLWILAGGALALAGLVLGFSPATPRGKRAI